MSELIPMTHLIKLSAISKGVFRYYIYGDSFLGLGWSPRFIYDRELFLVDLVV